MPDYRPVIPQSRPLLQAALGAIGASIIWGIVVVALCDHWHDPHQAAVRSDRLDWDRYPRPPYIPALMVQAPADERGGTADAQEPAPAPEVVELVKVNPVPPVSAERRVVNNGCSPGGERINFQYRGVWHYRCRY
jgi:hypothetical protein